MNICIYILKSGFNDKSYSEVFVRFRTHPVSVGVGVVVVEGRKWLVSEGNGNGANREWSIIRNFMEGNLHPGVPSTLIFLSYI